MPPDVQLLIVAVISAIGVVFLRDGLRGLRNLLQQRREHHTARYVNQVNHSH